jgi:hypothetical protein
MCYNHNRTSGLFFSSPEQQTLTGVSRDLFGENQKDAFVEEYKHYMHEDPALSAGPNTMATLPSICIVCVCSAPPDIRVVLLCIGRINIVTFLSQRAAHELHPPELVNSTGQQHAIVMQVGALLTARLQREGNNGEGAEQTCFQCKKIQDTKIKTQTQHIKNQFHKEKNQLLFDPICLHLQQDL